MTLTAPTRRKPPRGFRPTTVTHDEPARSTAPEGTFTPSPSTPAAPAQFVLMVDFTSRGGRTWWAVGVGDTLADALAFAQDSCPTDTTWQPIRWNELYAD